MSGGVTPIWPGADDTDPNTPSLDEPWMSTEASIDPETGQRTDPFETIRPAAKPVTE